MNKAELKAQFILLQTERVEKMYQAVSSYNEAKDLDESDTLDLADYSHQSESGNLASQLELQYQLEKNQLDALRKLSTDECSKVELGALVHLGNMWVYVSVSASAFEFDGKNVHPISTLAPIYASMKGKGEKESVTMNNGAIQIINAIY